jgi:hypothetical protein
MSFVPAPQKANASGNAASSTTSNHAVIQPKGVLSKQEAAAAATVAATTDELAQDEDSIFKLRTFDVYWVEKESLMYKDGLAKVRKIPLNCFAACILIPVHTWMMSVDVTAAAPTFNGFVLCSFLICLNNG